MEMLIYSNPYVNIRHVSRPYLEIRASEWNFMKKKKQIKHMCK